jgi:FKBP-type peptidyl-prolyl cis-trans isomerase FklB
MFKYFGIILIVVLTGCGGQPSKKLSESELNLIESEIWLKNNLKNIGVLQTKSGLQYKKIITTNKCKPDADFPLMLHYDLKSSTEMDVLDSSYLRGSPGKFPIKKMISAWVEGVPMMREGEKWLFYVHPKLAYGEKGSSPKIGKNVVLIFTVELVKVGKCV